MKATKILLSKMLVSVSVLGLGMVALPGVLKAESTLPPGYTVSKSPIAGQHCYRHGGNRTQYYCYTQTIESMRNNGSMQREGSMKPEGSMMQNNGSMQREGSMQNGGSMKPEGSMQNSGGSMKPEGSMQNNGSMQHEGSTMKK